MAITQTRINRDTALRLEHFYGSAIRNVQSSYDRYGTMILFEDGRQGFLQEGCRLDSIQWIEQYKPFCISCGETHGPGIHDSQGRCPTTIKRFWNKVRRLYWHRYSKSKET